jgi:predicted alpha/beta-fold hydrolase
MMIFGSNKLVIISHGLEGNSTRGYVCGMVKALMQHGFDVLAWNYRGCSGSINKKLKFYHSGATDDLSDVVNHVLQHKVYQDVYLVGFSLGGNLTLKYLGEQKSSSVIKKAVAFSVPTDLHSSCIQLSTPSNIIYARRFLKSLKAKVVLKGKQFTELDLTMLPNIRSLIDFDDAYTAPLHGFSSAIDYYTKSSANQFIKDIKTPTIIINSANDPFLSKPCYPFDLVRQNNHVALEVPTYGGHVGFTLFGQNGLFWSELKAIEFFTASK